VLNHQLQGGFGKVALDFLPDLDWKCRRLALWPVILSMSADVPAAGDLPGMPKCTDPARREVGGIALRGAQASKDPAAPGAAAAAKHCVRADELRLQRAMCICSCSGVSRLTLNPCESVCIKSG